MTIWKLSNWIGSCYAVHWSHVVNYRGESNHFNFIVFIHKEAMTQNFIAFWPCQKPGLCEVNRSSSPKMSSHILYIVNLQSLGQIYLYYCMQGGIASRQIYRQVDHPYNREGQKTKFDWFYSSIVLFSNDLKNNYFYQIFPFEDIEMILWFISEDLQLYRKLPILMNF